jgi:predicted transcriptional regulator
MQTPRIVVTTALDAQTTDRLDRFAQIVNANRSWVLRELVAALLTTNPDGAITFQNWRKLVLEHLGPTARLAGHYEK